MTEPKRRPPSTDSARQRQRQRSGSLRWYFWLSLVLLSAAGGWFLVQLGQQDEMPVDDLNLPDEQTIAGPAAGDRAVVLVFPEWDASGYVTERRRIPSRGRAEEDLLALMNQLCAGPGRSGAISALPQGTRAVAAFLDSDGSRAVLDFSVELVVRHPGGSAAEAATLMSVLRTVALNFPKVQTCRILVDGAELETLGGHLALDAEFDLRRWL